MHSLLHLLNLHPPAPAPTTKQALPLSPPKKWRLKGSRAKGKSTDYSMKNWHKWQRQLCVKNLRVTLSQTWQLNQFVCTVPTRIQMSAWEMSVATTCFISTILCLIPIHKQCCCCKVKVRTKYVAGLLLVYRTMGPLQWVLGITTCRTCYRLQSQHSFHLLSLVY